MKEGFKNLIVWRKAYHMVLEIYKITKSFPVFEQYGLTSQIRRSAISVTGNISEGYERRYRKEYVHFLKVAQGPLGEIEAYLLLSKDLGYINAGQFQDLDVSRKEVGKILTGLINSIRSGIW